MRFRKEACGTENKMGLTVKIFVALCREDAH